MNKPKYTQMKASDIKVLREKLHRENNYKCPILNEELPPEYMVLDHVHGTIKGKPSVETGEKLIRGSIDSNINVFLGKLENSFYGITGLSNRGYHLPTILRSVADYIEKYEDRKEYPVNENNEYYIHPSEAPKLPKITLSSYQKLCKELDKIGYKNKYPNYNKTKKPSQTLTQALKKCYDLVNLEPEYYK